MVAAAAYAFSPLNFAATSSKSRVAGFHYSPLIKVPKKHFSVTCAAKFPGTEHFHEPTKLINFLNKTKENLWKSMPDSIKNFPWKKAEFIALEEFLVLVKETLKWSLLALFALNFLSDIFYSISINRELVIPLGLFAGILATKFFDEISQELMPDHQDGRVTLRFLGIASFFVLVKVASYFSGANAFLLHVANGGLLQVLWNYKDMKKVDGEISYEISNPVPVVN